MCHPPGHMDARLPKPRTFGQKLATELEARNLGKRTLARMIDPTNVEHTRRSIHKWTAEGVEPTEASRRSVTDALGLEPGSLDSDDEEDVMAPLMRDVFHAAFTDPVLRDRFKRALEDSTAA